MGNDVGKEADNGGFVEKRGRAAQKILTDDRCLSLEIGRDSGSNIVFHFEMCVRRLAPRQLYLLIRTAEAASLICIYIARDRSL